MLWKLCGINFLRLKFKIEWLWFQLGKLNTCTCMNKIKHIDLLYVSTTHLLILSHHYKLYLVTGLDTIMKCNQPTKNTIQLQIIHGMPHHNRIICLCHIFKSHGGSNNRTCNKLTYTMIWLHPTQKFCPHRCSVYTHHTTYILKAMLTVCKITMESIVVILTFNISYDLWLLQVYGQELRGWCIKI